MHGSPTTRYCDQVRSAIGPELLRLVHNTQTRFTESDTHVRTCAQVLNKVNRQACIGRAIVNLTKNDVKIPSAGPSNWEDLGAPILCTTGIKRSLYTNTSRPYFFWETNVSVSVGDALEPRVYQRPSLALPSKTRTQNSSNFSLFPKYALAHHPNITHSLPSALICRRPQVFLGA